MKKIYTLGFIFLDVVFIQVAGSAIPGCLVSISTGENYALDSPAHSPLRLIASEARRPNATLETLRVYAQLVSEKSSSLNYHPASTKDVNWMKSFQLKIHMVLCMLGPTEQRSVQKRRVLQPRVPMHLSTPLAKERRQ
jgi:hypothetical protein